MPIKVKEASTLHSAALHSFVGMNIMLILLVEMRLKEEVIV
jgi:hypothetical protein